MKNQKTQKNDTILAFKISTEKWVFLYDLNHNIAVFSAKTK
jgi:hypothetical protein